MPKKKTTASPEEPAEPIQLDSDGLRLRLSRLGEKLTIELTEHRPPASPIRQTINFERRADVERWMDAERFALERPLLYQALTRQLDRIWNEGSTGGQP